MPTERQQIAEAATRQLINYDIELAPVIRRFGPYTVEPHGNYYQELVDAIVSQQLSVKASATILKRFIGLFDNTTFPTPEQILAKDVDELRAAGLSRAKANYVQDLAMHILNGTLQLDKLPSLPNDEVILELVAVKGIGEWTAHMFLIFCLGRLDVLATGDLGVRTAMTKLYGLETLPTPLAMRKIADEHHWSPYESVACWYLWKSLDNEPATQTKS
jgi:DNA-3-methyladenine glycosylase II